MMTDHDFFAHAELAAQKGTCSRLKVGAVLVKHDHIISTGYNGVARGLPHCEHSNDKPCHKSVHAEINVLLNAARYGIATMGSAMYTTHAPCGWCAGLIINAGISVVKYLNHYRNELGLVALMAVGVAVEHVDTNGT